MGHEELIRCRTQPFWDCCISLWRWMNHPSHQVPKEVHGRETREVIASALNSMHHTNRPSGQNTRSLEFGWAVERCNIGMRFNDQFNRSSTLYKLCGISNYCTESMSHRSGIWPCVDRHHGPCRHGQVVYLGLLNMLGIVVRPNAAGQRQIAKQVAEVKVGM